MLYSQLVSMSYRYHGSLIIKPLIMTNMLLKVKIEDRKLYKQIFLDLCIQREMAWATSVLGSYFNLPNKIQNYLYRILKNILFYRGIKSHFKMGSSNIQTQIRLVKQTIIAFKRISYSIFKYNRPEIVFGATIPASDRYERRSR